MCISWQCYYTLLFLNDIYVILTVRSFLKSFHIQEWWVKRKLIERKHTFKYIKSLIETSVEVIYILKHKLKVFCDSEINYIIKCLCLFINETTRNELIFSLCIFNDPSLFFLGRRDIFLLFYITCGCQLRKDVLTSWKIWTSSSFLENSEYSLSKFLIFSI